MAEIKADFASIDALITSIENAEENIETSTKNISKPSSCSGILLTSYVEHIKRIGKLLKSYKGLLEKDAADFENSKNKIAEMDVQLKNLYNSNS